MDPRRRSFLRGKLHDAAAETVVAPPRPPWSLRPDATFTAACTRCGDCVKACPRGVLKGGDGGFPQIDFSRAGCSLCGDCATVCASGAIAPTRQPQAFGWRVQVADHCLSRRGVECRVCGDACDARALRFVPARGGIAQLQVDSAACTGCGDCLSVCPVTALSVG
ncbi:MAG: ferredoxin-type protein NapF [Piscinibacter sp.]